MMKRSHLAAIAPLARRWFAYLAITLLGAIAPLLALPLIARRYGAAGWTAVAIGQSVGSAGAVCIAFGWPLLGPAQAALGDPAFRATLLKRAWSTNAAIAVLILPAVTACAYLAAKSNVATCVLSAWSTAALGFSLSWYFIGRSSPGRLLMADVGPRVAGALLGVAFVESGFPLWSYPACGLATYLPGLALAYRREFAQCPRAPRLSWVETRLTLAAQRAGAITQLSSIVYINLPLTLFAFAGAAGVAEFAAADRIYRLTLVALQPITQVFQGWVPSSDRGNDRAKTSLLTHLSIGLLGAVVSPVAFPLASRILFGNTAHLGYLLGLIYGAIICVVLVTRSLSAGYLVLNHKSKALASSAILGSVLGLILIPSLARAWGPPGAATGVLVSEGAVLLVQARSAYHIVRHIGRHRSASSPISARRSATDFPKAQLDGVGDS